VVNDVSSDSVVNDTALERGREAGDAELARRADWTRLKTVELIAQAGLGHYSSTFSCAEIIATLYYSVPRLDPAFPGWPDRDRFLLGKGHVATGLWPVLADLGYYPSDWLRQFGTVGSPLNDHPNMKLARRDYRVFVLTGDGELQEGQVREAAMAASHYKLGNLVAIIDANGFSGSGPMSEAMNIEPLAARVNTVVVAPADAAATVALMRLVATLDAPTSIRIAEAPEQVYSQPPRISSGSGPGWPRAGTSRSPHTAWAPGLRCGAAQALRAQEGIAAEVLDAAFLKPFDEEALITSAAKTGRVLTIEDHSVVGGLGALVAETVARHRLAVELDQVALPAADLEVGVPAELYEYYGLTVDGVAAARELVKR
jgi:transketolase